LTLGVVEACVVVVVAVADVIAVDGCSLFVCLSVRLPACLSFGVCM
jgi:hypothetical protein